jgi:Caudovirus prohead serine protease
MPHDVLLTRDAPVDDAVLTRTAAIEPNSFDATNHSVRVIWSTGADVRRAGHIERLSLDPAHVNLDGLRGASVLDSHQRNGLRHVLGTVSEASVDGQAGHATIRLSKRTDVADIVADIRDGVIRHVSIGYTVDPNGWRDSIGPNGERVRTAVKWGPREISFVAVGADPGAYVRNAPDDSTTDRAAINTQIRTLGRTAQLTTEFVDSLIDRGATVEQARAAAFDELTRRRVNIPAYQLGASNDDPETIRTRMVPALANRLGAPGDMPAESVQYRGMGLHDMARSLLAARGERVLSMSPETLLTRAIGTSDIPILLQSTGQRTLLGSYQLALSPVFQLARQATATDFRTQSRVRLGEFEKLERVAESGEVTHGGVAETAESYALATYGKMFALTRQALINDDLGAFATISAAQGRAAAETQNDLVVTLLTQGSGLGPTMSDEDRLYHTDHGNVSGSGAAIDATTLAAGVLAMRTQKGVDSVTPINATPRYLLAPPGKETAARQGVASFYPATAATVNPLAGTLEVLIEPRLSGNRWYLFADPAVLPVLEYAYLASAPGPQMESRPGWEVLGIEFRVILDFGCGVTDWRGTYTNAGA